ncbi:hypothetical protein AGMMS49545_23270 [Betaproteobacteria bacterium]|nr:hypothetical protein AGMMS49545_23270 [Betaproteobacteria bacterium]GHU47882.1 hypothetical protein AGMMS50289_23720 [Betaproteobacteria bacterium]
MLNGPQNAFLKNPQRFARQIALALAEIKGIPFVSTASASWKTSPKLASTDPIEVQNLEDELTGWTLRPPSGMFVDTGKMTITQILTNRPQNNEQPRLCVALDFLQILSRELLSEYKAPLIFTPSSAQGYSAYIRKAQFDGITHITLSKQVQKLNCLQMEEMSVWVFKVEQGESKKDTPTGSWQSIKPTVKPDTGFWARDGHYHISFEDDTQKSMLEATLLSCDDARFQEPQVTTMQDKEQTRIAHKIWRCTRNAFCVIPLEKPPFGWSDDMKLDAWVFPLEIGMEESNMKPVLGGESTNIQFFFRRPEGERGEVPDWAFLATYFGEKGYPWARDVINSKKKTPEEATSKPDNPY